MCENCYAPLEFILSTVQKVVYRGHWELGLRQASSPSVIQQMCTEGLVCTGLCAKWWGSSEWSLNSRLFQFSSAAHPDLFPAPFSALRLALPSLYCGSPVTCLLVGFGHGGPWQETRGQKQREFCIIDGSCVSPPWWFPSPFFEAR